VWQSLEGQVAVRTLSFLAGTLNRRRPEETKSGFARSGQMQQPSFRKEGRRERKNGHTAWFGTEVSSEFNAGKLLFSHKA